VATETLCSTPRALVVPRKSAYVQHAPYACLWSCSVFLSFFPFVLLSLSSSFSLSLFLLLLVIVPYLALSFADCIPWAPLYPHRPLPLGSCIFLHTRFFYLGALFPLSQLHQSPISPSLTPAPYGTAPPFLQLVSLMAPSGGAGGMSFSDRFFRYKAQTIQLLFSFCPSSFIVHHSFIHTLICSSILHSHCIIHHSFTLATRLSKCCECESKLSIVDFALTCASLLALD